MICNLLHQSLLIFNMQPTLLLGVKLKINYFPLKFQFSNQLLIVFLSILYNFISKNWTMSWPPIIIAKLPFLPFQR